MRPASRVGVPERGTFSAGSPCRPAAIDDFLHGLPRRGNERQVHEAVGGALRREQALDDDALGREVADVQRDGQRPFESPLTDERFGSPGQLDADRARSGRIQRVRDRKTEMAGATRDPNGFGFGTNRLGSGQACALEKTPVMPAPTSRCSHHRRRDSHR
jgi:hypothetical protein